MLTGRIRRVDQRRRDRVQKMPNSGPRSRRFKLWTVASQRGGFLLAAIGSSSQQPTTALLPGPRASGEEWWHARLGGALPHLGIGDLV